MFGELVVTCLDRFQALGRFARGNGDEERLKTRRASECSAAFA